MEFHTFIFYATSKLFANSIKKFSVYSGSLRSRIVLIIVVSNLLSIRSFTLSMSSRLITSSFVSSKVPTRAIVVKF